MALPDAAVEHRAKLARFTLATMLAARRLWARAEEADLDGTYPAGQVLALLMAGQLAAATEGVAFVPLVLDEQGVDPDQIAKPTPRGLVGVTSSGYPLDFLAAAPLLRAKALIGRGWPASDAIESAGKYLDGIVQTQLADAARDGESIAMAATPAARGYVRHLNLPSCKDCAVLAGRFYRWSDGFDRHDNCDCVHLPANHPDAFRDLMDTKKLIEDGQVTGLSEADTKAIVEHGADPGRVINAARRTSRAQMPHHLVPQATVSRKITEAGTITPGPRRGRRTEYAQPRLRPESIYDIAKGDRRKALALLKENGYITQTAEQARLARAAARRASARN